MIAFFAILFAALFGLAFGSFLNVCLSRWPEGESVVKPRSHCRACGRTLAWWENLPVASWIALRGRCRSCQSAISWRYPLVEASVALLWGVTFARFVDRLLLEAPPEALVVGAAQALGTMLLLWLLVALAALDAEHMWLPDRLTLSGAALGVLAEGVHGWLQPGPPPNLAAFPASLEAMAVRVLEALGAAVLVLLVRWLYSLLRHREGLGLGDVKLMALLTAWLGLPGAALAFVVGVVLGTLAALLALLPPRREREPWGQTKLPLGTFLCLGGIVSVLWGPTLIARYLQWAGM